MVGIDLCGTPLIPSDARGSTDVDLVQAQLVQEAVRHPIRVARRSTFPSGTTVVHQPSRSVSRSAYEIMGLLQGVASLLNAEVTPTSRSQSSQASAILSAHPQGRIDLRVAISQVSARTVAQPKRHASFVDRAEGLS